MKYSVQLCLFVFLFSLSSSAIAQDRKGSFRADLGIGLGIYNAKVTLTPESGDAIEEEDTAGARLIPIRLEYGLGDRIGVGLYFQPAKYFEDVDQADMIDVETRGSSLGLYGNYYFVNGDRFESQAHIGFGLTNMRQERVNNDTGDESNASYSGGNFRFGLGLRWYFTQHIGIFFDPHYQFLSMELQEQELNGEEQDLDGTLELDLRGMEFKVGISGRF